MLMRLYHTHFCVHHAAIPVMGRPHVSSQILHDTELIKTRMQYIHKAQQNDVLTANSESEVRIH